METGFVSQNTIAGREVRIGFVLSARHRERAEVKSGSFRNSVARPEISIGFVPLNESRRPDVRFGFVS